MQRKKRKSSRSKKKRNEIFLLLLMMHLLVVLSSGENTVCTNCHAQLYSHYSLAIVLKINRSTIHILLLHSLSFYPFCKLVSVLIRAQLGNLTRLVFGTIQKKRSSLMTDCSIQQLPSLVSPFLFFHSSPLSAGGTRLP